MRTLSVSMIDAHITSMKTVSIFCKNLKLYTSDIFHIFLKAYIWAYFDLKNRYRRSFLGPFWETINMTVMILGMSFVSSALFGVNTSQMLPYLGIGIIFWTVISSSINEGCNSLIENAALIQNSNNNIFLYIGRVVFRIYLSALHHLVLVIPAISFGLIKLNINTVMFFVGFFLLIINSTWVTGAFGILSTRFRDLAMIVRNITQLLFFVTPIFWDSSLLPSNRRFITELNPFYYFLEIVRAPLLGKVVALEIYLIVIAFTLIGYLTLFLIYRRFRENIVFYL